MILSAHQTVAHCKPCTYLCITVNAQAVATVAMVVVVIYGGTVIIVTSINLG